MSAPKKHHTVPRSILRNFSVDGTRTQVHVFDKSTGRSFLNAIEDAGCETYFNTVELNGETISFEALFDDNDGRLAFLIERLVRERTLACLDTGQRQALARVVAVQVLRTKMLRTTMRSLAVQFAASLSEAGFDPDEVQGFSIPTDQEIRRTALATLLDADAVVSAIEAKRAFLVRPDLPDQPFWISDNPVALQQTFPYSDLSLSAPGVEIYFPIARDLALAFYCPSIELQMGRALAAGDTAIDRAKFLEIYRGLQTGCAVSLGPDTTRFLNELQVLRSSRFVYGPTDDFALARRVIDRLPHARTKKMGEGHQRRPGMPPGLCVVFYGRRDHHVLHVDTWNDDERGYLSVTTRDVQTLERVVEDQPLVEAVLYQDGWQRLGMRDVRVDVVQGDVAEVRVLHRDETLNQLMGLVSTR